jgi:serine/threonine-protein kinase HipA
VLDAPPVRPLLAGEEGLRLSLAGAQSKVPVVMVDGAVALPACGQPATHVLKPPIARFSAMTENEAFVMRLAAAVGLEVFDHAGNLLHDAAEGSGYEEI